MTVYRFAILSFVDHDHMLSRSQDSYGVPGAWSQLLPPGAKVINVCLLPTDDLGRNGIRLMVTYSIRVSG